MIAAVFLCIVPGTVCGQIFVVTPGLTSGTNGSVGEYTASGAVVNTSLISGLANPQSIAISGSNLFVLNYGSGTVGKYTLSGSAVNASFVAGLGHPATFAVSGTTMYIVTNNGTSSWKIGSYALSGSAINTSLATGQGILSGVVVSGSNLFVSENIAFNQGTWHIGQYTTSGSTVNATLVTGTNYAGDFTGSGTNLYLETVGVIKKYTTSGSLVNSSLVSGLVNTHGIAVSGTDMFVVAGSGTSNFTLRKYNTQGALVADSLVTGLNSTGIAVQAAPVITSPPSVTGTMGFAFSYQITASNNPTNFTADGLPSALHINTSTGLISGTPAVTGTFNSFISAINASGTGSANLSLILPTPYQAWQSTWFTAGQIADPAISGYTASPAGDGVTNLMKYSLGLNPTVSYSGTSAGLPYSGLTSGTDPCLTLTFTGVAIDATYIVQATSDLTGVWTTLYNSTPGVAPGTVTVSDTLPISATPKRFMHLQVTGP